MTQLKIMTRTDLLLTPDNEHDKESSDAPITGFCGAEFKDILVRAKIPGIKNGGWRGPCEGP